MAMGSRGDVQPFIALAAGLQRAGCAVRVATHAEFLPLIAGRGIDFSEIRGNPRALLEDDRAHDMLAAGENPLQFLTHFTKLLAPVFTQMVLDCTRAAEGADAVVLSNVGLIGGFHQIAQALGVPYCAAVLQPFTPTAAFPSAFFPALPAWWRLGRGAYHRATHWAFIALFTHFFGGVVPEVRRALGLAPRSRMAVWREEAALCTPVLHGYSPAVIPRPADWPPHLHVTGYWFLDGPVGWQPAPDLQAFLDAGPPPVYLGFGSMRTRDPEATTALVRAALRRAGLRGVLLSGWGGLHPGDLGDDVCVVESVSHHWLLPRMAAVVHHGGAGTTAAGLHAGVPSFAVPFFADQPFWGRTLHELGVGPAPVPYRRLTVDRLAAALSRAVHDEGLRARAAEMGRIIRAEDGVGQAVELMLRHFERKTE